MSWLSPGYEWVISPDEEDFAQLPDWILEIAHKIAHKRTANTETRRAAQSLPVSNNLCPSSGGGLPSNSYVLLGRPDQHRQNLPTRAPSTLVRVHADTLKAWLERLDVGIAAAQLMGLPTRGLKEKGRGVTFSCVLPGHKERRPSASLYRDPLTEAVVYRDWHLRNGREWYSLADVYASLHYGETRILRGPELATWQLRLLVETGFLRAAEVKAPRLPKDISPSLRQVWEGFLFLLGCKWLHTPGDPSPFTKEFAAAWCGVSVWTAREAIRELMRRGFMRRVGQHGRLWLFLPGSPS